MIGNGGIALDARQGRQGRAIDLQLHRWKRCEDRLLSKLMNYARNTAGGSGLSYALEQFWGTGGLASHDFNDEPGFARFFDWFVFDYRRNRRSRRMIERFRADHGRRLSPEERQLLDAWLDTRLGIYEVVSLDAGRTITIADIFTGQRFTVVEKAASRSLHKYDLILVRVLPVFAAYGLSTAGLVIPRVWKPALETWVAAALSRFRRESPDADWAEFFRSRAHHLNRFLVGLLLDPPVPRLQTSTGEDLVFCRACYDVRDAEAVVKILSGLPDVTASTPRRDRSGRLAGAVWAWQAGSSLPGLPVPLPAGLVLGTIRLEKGRLWLDCVSQARLRAGRQMLEEALAGRIRHRFDTIDGQGGRHSLRPGEVSVPAADVFGLLPREHGGKDRVRPAAPEEERAGLNKALQRFMDDYYTRWADRPIPALGGRTPRDACNSSDGRAMVIELLKFIENMEEKKRRAGEPYFEVNRLRRELDLPEE